MINNYGQTKSTLILIYTDHEHKIYTMKKGHVIIYYPSFQYHKQDFDTLQQVTDREAVKSAV